LNEPNGDQRVKRYQGSYTLEPEAGTPSDPASWRIASASIAEVASAAQPAADVADQGSLVRAYFAAIGRREYARAYTYWDSLGKASQQTYLQFAEGFATTDRVSVDLGEPRAGGAAGSIYAEVPVVVVATENDRTTRTLCGTYTLRRANVPPFGQLGWRIEQANVAPTAKVELGSPEAKRLLTGGCGR
jgi:hypothetical protein